MIIDDKRFIAVVHPADQDYYLTILSKEEMDRLSIQTDDPFIDLWKDFSIRLGLKNEKIISVRGI